MNQFIRKASLIVSTGTVGLDLSQFRFTFSTRNADEQAPNTLYARVYNLAPTTVQKIQKEFTSITLQAGYQNSYGIIFSGTIKEIRVGREKSVDSYIDIYAADGDIFYNHAIINQSVAAGQTPQQVIESIQSASSVPIKFSSDASGLIAGAPLGAATALSRGKTRFGLARDYARDWAQKYGFQWSIQNGEFVVVPLTGYRPNEAVVLSSTTGLIGVPEACNDGLRVRALLNPKIQIGCLIQIAQSDINQITVQQQGLAYQPAIAQVTTAAGFYRVLVAEFEGDSRGQAWYVNITAIAVDVTASNQSESVQAFG